MLQRSLAVSMIAVLLLYLVVSLAVYGESQDPITATPTLPKKELLEHSTAEQQSIDGEQVIEAPPAAAQPPPLFDVVIPHYIADINSRRSRDVLFKPLPNAVVHVVTIYGHNSTVTYTDPVAGITTVVKRDVDNIVALKKRRPKWDKNRVKQRQQLKDLVLALNMYHPKAEFALMMDDDTEICEGAEPMLHAFLDFAKQEDGEKIKQGFIRIGPGTSGLILLTDDLKESLVPYLKHVVAAYEWPSPDHQIQEWSFRAHRYIYRNNLVHHHEEDQDHQSTIWDSSVVAKRAHSLAGCFDLASWNAGGGASFDFEKCYAYALSPCDNHNWKAGTDHSLYASPKPGGKARVNGHIRAKGKFEFKQTHELSGGRFKLMIASLGQSCTQACKNLNAPPPPPPVPSKPKTPPARIEPITKNKKSVPKLPPTVAAKISQAPSTGAKPQPKPPTQKQQAATKIPSNPTAPKSPPKPKSAPPTGYYCDANLMHTLNDCTLVHQLFKVPSAITCGPSASSAAPGVHIKSDKVQLNVYASGWDSTASRIDCGASDPYILRFCWCTKA